MLRNGNEQSYAGGSERQRLDEFDVLQKLRHHQQCDMQACDWSRLAA
jgi:hypothetical protein